VSKLELWSPPRDVSLKRKRNDIVLALFIEANNVLKPT
jgi:hypothetical protein